MLISFTLQNFRSFRDRYTLNLHVEQGDELAQNIAWSDKDKKIPVLRTAAIYGPNASGKSNLLRSMLYALQLILPINLIETVVCHFMNRIYWMKKWLRSQHILK